MTRKPANLSEDEERICSLKCCCLKPRNGSPAPPPIGKVLELPIEPCILWSASGPFFGGLICVLLAWFYQYDLVTSEAAPPGCNVTLPHVLPSLSMAIGVYKPNKFIWLFLIVLHFAPRPFLARIYHIHWASSTVPYAQWRIYRYLNVWSTFTYYAGMVGILILTIVDFDSHFYFHCTGFGVWLVASCCFMATNAGFHHYSGWRSLSRRNEVLLWLKVFLALAQITIAISAAHIYVAIYAGQCRVWGHSLFTLLEYLLLFLDIVFCCMPAFDFPGVRLGLYVDYSGLTNGKMRYPTESPPQFYVNLHKSSAGAKTFL